jgi:peptide/nickel transport system permease protein
MDLLFAFPAILLAIVIMAGLGTSIVNAMIAIGIIFIPGFARLARVLTQSVMKERFIDYSRSIGTPAWLVIVNEILPNTWPPLLVQASAAMAYAVTIEAALSFLGLGAQPPTPSWGNMIDAGRGYLAQAPWMALAPGAALFLAVVSLNLLGEGLRELWDPRSAR